MRTFIISLLLGTIMALFTQVTAQTTFSYLPLRASSQGFGTAYDLTTEPLVVEQARLLRQLGCDSYKFIIGWDQYRTIYPDLPILSAAQRRTTVDLLNNEPAFRTVLDMDFKYFVLWAYAMQIPYWHFGNGLSAAQSQLEYDQIYALTRYLMQRYQNTGKVFMLGSWENDWVLLEGYDANATPRASMIQGMKDWYTMRQRAISDARASLPDVKGVEVYHYVEVNLIDKALNQGAQRVVNSVLPYVTVDLVSYSAYDATNYTAQLPSRLIQHLNYIQSQAHFSGAWAGGKSVFIGEYGYNASPGTDRLARNVAALKAASQWGCPLVLFWSIYDTNADTHSSLRLGDGSNTLEYTMTRNYIGRLSVYRDAMRVWLRRNPTDAEVNNWSSAFDTTLNHAAVQQVMDGSAFLAQTTHANYLHDLFTSLGLGSDVGQSDYQNYLTQLTAGSTTRYQVLLALLDSAHFAQVVSTPTYETFLKTYMLENSAATLPAGATRSAQYVACLDSDAFLATALTYGKLQTLTPQLKNRYIPNFVATPAQLQSRLEDFKSAPSGFDLNWTAVQLNNGSGTPDWKSDGETAALSITNDPQQSAGATVDVPAGDNSFLIWDTDFQRDIQLMVPYLEYGDRLLVMIRTRQTDWQLLHDQWTEIPGQYGRPHTLNVNSVLGNGLHEVKLRLLLANSQYGSELTQAFAYLDWIKIGLPSPLSAAPGSPNLLSPADQAIVMHPPVLRWSNVSSDSQQKYIVSISTDPAFRNHTTTWHDLRATSQALAMDLPYGKYYWTVSALAADGHAGPFHEKATAGGDSRDPLNHQFYSFRYASPTAASSETLEFN